MKHECFYLNNKEQQLAVSLYSLIITSVRSIFSAISGGFNHLVVFFGFYSMVFSGMGLYCVKVLFITLAPYLWVFSGH